MSDTVLINRGLGRTSVGSNASRRPDKPANTVER